MNGLRKTFKTKHGQLVEILCNQSAKVDYDQLMITVDKGGEIC